MARDWRLPDKDAEAAVERRWQERVKRVLKSELTRAGVSYEELSRRLKVMGVQTIGPANLMNKVSRGTFSATFFFQCMEAIGVGEVRLRRPRAFQPLTDEDLELLGKAADEMLALRDDHDT